MKQIEWDNSFEIGVQLLDEHHQTLLKRLNDVSKAVDEHQGEREITRTLKFLSDYTQFHFSAEEEKMKAADYPGLEKQIEEHKKFLVVLEKLEEDFRDEDATKALSESLNTFLFTWLIHHIKEVDAQFGVYLKEKGL